jgi:dienelactone hydrolase
MRRCMLMAVVAAGSLISTAARAEVRTKTVDYKQGKTVLQGFLAWDDAVKDKRPGVLVIHEWWGHNQHARNQAIRLAKQGYVGFAVDMYGKGKVAKHPKDAEAMMTALMKDQSVIKARFDAGLEALKKDPHVDASKVGVVGYCMGGAIAIGMARAGEDITAISAFHAALPPAAEPTKPGTVKAKIQIHEGADDPFVPQDAIDAFKKDMAGAGATAEVITYPGVKHSFTNPDADKVKMDALKYDKDADTKSWETAMKFFKDAFGV